MKMEIRKYPRVRDIAEYMGFEILVAEGAEKRVVTQSVYRPGYELCGIFSNIVELETNINILGSKECRYLERLDKERRRNIFLQYFSYKFPVLIVTFDSYIVEEIKEIAKIKRKAILKTKFKSMELIRNLKSYMQKILAEEEIIEDYILLDVFGVGIMVTGYKDACVGVAVELLERKHKFISNKNLKIMNIAGRYLVGSNSSDLNHFYLFSKDGNVIDVTTHFGIRSTEKSKRISLIVELEKWDKNKFYDRLGLDEEYDEFLGIKVPKVTLPVRKGRNLAIILETAAINYRLKKTGINSAEYFWKESQKIIAENRKRGIEVGDKKLLPVKMVKDKFNLEVLNGEELLEKKYIKSTGVHRPALALTGYLDMFQEEGYDGVQLFTQTEFEYLDTLSEEKREENLSKYLENDFPLILVSGIEEIPEYFLTNVKKRNMIVLRVNLDRTSHIVALFSAYLEKYFAPTISLHGVFVELYGFGVLLTGRSGVGKSETALELIHRGHRLIADDLVKFDKGLTGDITGRASRLPYFMEIRGLGIIDVKALYGVGAVRISKKLDMIIELQDLKNEEYLTAVDYLGSTENILGEEITKVKLYISSGRNAAAMVEIAVMNLMAKKMGYNSEEHYLKEILKKSTELN